MMPKYTPQARYDAANTTRIHIKLNNITDRDILDELARQPNKQGYIKGLIRAAIDASERKQSV